MVLSGTLREFILADVFQLLTQQKITGKLVLSNGHSEGVVVFKNGLIVAAEKEDEKLVSKLQFYLIDIKKQATPKIRDLASLYQNDLNGFSSEIVNQGMLSKQELFSFAEIVTEDIACSLFQWKSGTYRFSSLRTVDSLISANISIPVENIVMEAMRRVDEWNRMSDKIKDDNIFVRSNKDEVVEENTSDPMKEADHYLFGRINGTSPVKELYKKSCLTEYKVYEALNILLQNEKIALLSTEFSNSVQAAINKKENEKVPTSLSLFISILSTAGMILLILLLSSVLFRNVIFEDITVKSSTYKLENSIKLAQQKIKIARLYYLGQYGKEPRTLEELKKVYFITPNEYQTFNRKTKVDLNE